MLRIVENIDSGPVIHSFFDSRFKTLYDESIWKGALCLEYWEDQTVNFKFSVLGGIIGIYSCPFVDQFPMKDIEMFFGFNVTLEDLLEWVRDNLSLEILRSCPPEDPSISRIWEFSDKRWCYGTEEKDYVECKISGKLVKCLPNRWGYELRFWSKGTEKERLYLYNLYLLKKYVTRKYQGSD